MYEHILIPVTFDEACDTSAAIQAAKALCNENARATFLHVVEPLPHYVDAHINITLEERSLPFLNDRLNKMAEQLPGATGVVIHGAAGREIVDWAANNGVDCIAISSHRPVFSDIFLGSTAAWVVRHAQCAVHVLR